MMMEGTEEAAGLAANESSPYATPPDIRSPSPSNQLTCDGSFTDRVNANSNLIFASSASHTLFPAARSVINDDDGDGDDGENDVDGDDNVTSTGRGAGVKAAARVTAPTGTGPAETPSPSLSASNAKPAPQDDVPISDADLEQLILHPWSPSSRLSFHQKFNLSNPSYKNKLRLTSHAEARIRHFLLNPNSSLDARFPTDARLKHRSKGYALHPFSPDGHLYRIDASHSNSNDKGASSSSSPSPSLRRHVSDTEVWDLLTSEHVRSGHKGRDRMLGLIKERFVGYTLEELMFVLGSCRVCQRARMGGGAGGASGIELAQRVKSSLNALNLSTSPAEPLPAVTGADIQGRPSRFRLSAGEMLHVTPSAGYTIAGAAAPEQSMSSMVGAMFAPPAAMAAETSQAWPLQQEQELQHSSGGGMGYVSVSGRSETPRLRRKDQYAPDERGLVAYNIPDWYE